jgi:hypothetical protein
LKKHSKSTRQSEPTTKRTKSRGPMQRKVKEVRAEVLGKLTGRGPLEAGAVSAKSRARPLTSDLPVFHPAIVALTPSAGIPKGSGNNYGKGCNVVLKRYGF